MSELWLCRRRNTHTNTGCDSVMVQGPSDQSHTLPAFCLNPPVSQKDTSPICSCASSHLKGLNAPQREQVEKLHTEYKYRHAFTQGAKARQIVLRANCTPVTTILLVSNPLLDLSNFCTYQRAFVCVCLCAWRQGGWHTDTCHPP